MSESKGGGMETAASSASHLIFPTVFGLFSSSGVSDRFIPSNQHQVGGSQAGLCSLSAGQSPTQASMTNRLGFPCHNIPLPNPRLMPRLSPFLLSHSPPPPPPPFLALFCHVFISPGGYSSREQCDPHWRSLHLSLSSNRFCSLCCFGIGVRMLIPKTANLTSADTILPHTPQKQPPPHS